MDRVEGNSARMRQGIVCFVLAATIAINTDGCCRPLPPQPSRPARVEGWEDSDSGSGFRFRAVLLLKKGESSDNGKIGVKVTDIAEAEQCGDVGIEYHRRATVQFFSPSDGRMLCEEIVVDHGNSTIGCGESLGVDVIGVRAISTAEGWVLFDLRY